MISSTSSSERSPRLDPAAWSAATKPRWLLGRDQVSTGGAARLEAELRRQPEIRPEVVERARALIADPAYPPPAAIRKVAQQILASPDLSEES